MCGSINSVIIKSKMNKKTMKKIKIGILIAVFLVSGNNAFARINEDPNIAGNHSLKVLNSDVVDLQKQIDQLNQKNAQLEARMFQIENKPASQVISSPAVPQASPNDAGQTVRIENLEKRVGVLEGLLNSLKTSIAKVLDLLTKLLSKI